MTTEKMTIYELIVLADQNFDAISAIWTEMPETTTMAVATIEWAKRNGRIIEIVDSKMPSCHFIAELENLHS